MRLLSDAAEYALRAVVWLAQNPDGPQTTQQIAAGTKATPGYLAKTLQLLVRGGLVTSQRGIGGGFLLTRSPADITVLQVVNAADPIERITSCPLGLESHRKGLCALHRRVDDALAQIEEAFGTTTIADVYESPGRSRPLCSISVSAGRRRP